MSTPRSVIIIGAGPSGLFAAKELKKAGVEVTLIEKADDVGGQCNTFTDPKTGQNTEMGALYVVGNYGPVIEEVEKQKAALSRTAHTEIQSLDIYQTFKNASFAKKAAFVVKFPYQLYKFTKATSQYQAYRDKQLPLPADFKLSFTAYAKKHGITLVDDFVRSIVSGFGYGPTTTCPTYAVMAYMGRTTIPLTIMNSLISTVGVVTNGYQSLMEGMAKDFNVITSADVVNIDRSEAGVTVTYRKDGKLEKQSADVLGLAISPQHWDKLGLKLGDVEKECAKKVKFYHYPTAACLLGEFPPHYRFFSSAYKEDGLEHLALITTKDKNPATKNRLCTAYVNLKRGENNFSLEKDSTGLELLKQELADLKDVKKVEVLHTKVWPDYFPTLPWNTRLHLEKEQMTNRTFYVGPHMLGSFSDVKCVSEYAKKAVSTYVTHTPTKDSWAKSIWRAYQFRLALGRGSHAVATMSPMSDLAGHISAFENDQKEVTIASTRAKLRGTPITELAGLGVAAASVVTANSKLGKCPFAGVTPTNATVLFHPDNHTGFYDADGNLDHQKIDMVWKKYAIDGIMPESRFTTYLDKSGINKKLTPLEYGALFKLYSRNNGLYLNQETQKEELYITKQQLIDALSAKFSAVIDSAKKPDYKPPAYEFKPGRTNEAFAWMRNKFCPVKASESKPAQSPVQRRLMHTKVGSGAPVLFRPRIRPKAPAAASVVRGLKMLLK